MTRETSEIGFSQPQIDLSNLMHTATLGEYFNATPYDDISGTTFAEALTERGSEFTAPDDNEIWVIRFDDNGDSLPIPTAIWSEQRKSGHDSISPIISGIFKAQRLVVNPETRHSWYVDESGQYCAQFSLRDSASLLHKAVTAKMTAAAQESKQQRKRELVLRLRPLIEL